MPLQQDTDGAVHFQFGSTFSTNALGSKADEAVEYAAGDRHLNREGLGKQNMPLSMGSSLSQMP